LFRVNFSRKKKPRISAGLPFRWASALESYDAVFVPIKISSQL
jgi:hypothetical protein